jgi:RNase H-fold protein (predicted Holliday junction resolvase)
MKLLGIDYGRSRIGLAVSDGIIAEPLKVIKVKNREEGIRKVSILLKIKRDRCGIGNFGRNDGTGV